MDAHPHRAIIGGKAVEFSSIEDKFNALVSEWIELCMGGSSTGVRVNDAYGQIVAMGREVIPLLLREVKNDTGHWSSALLWITSADIITDDVRGNAHKLRELWLNWGRENGYQF